MAIIVDPRQQVFEEPAGSFALVDTSGQPDFTSRLGYMVEYTSAYASGLEADRESTDVYSEIFVQVFGTGFLNPLSQTLRDAYVIQSQAYPATSRQLTDFYAAVPVLTFGERTVNSKVVTSSANNVGEVWTSLIVTSVSNTALIESIVTDTARNNSKVGIVEESFALVRTAPFGTGVTGFSQQDTTALDPNMSYSSNKIVVETVSGRSFALNTSVIPQSAVKFSLSKARVNSAGISTALNTSYFAQAKTDFVYNKPAQLASQLKKYAGQNIFVASEKLVTSQHTSQVYEGATVFTLVNSRVVSAVRKSARNTVVFPIVARRNARNSVKSASTVLDLAVNNVKMKVGPSLSLSRHTVKVLANNTTNVNGSTLDNDLFRDPLFHEYVFGFN